MNVPSSKGQKSWKLAVSNKNHYAFLSHLLCSQGDNLKQQLPSQKEFDQPWLIWLNGLSAGLRTKALPVQFPVRAHVWVAGHVPSMGYTLMRQPYIDVSLLLSKNKEIKSLKKSLIILSLYYTSCVHIHI